MGNHEQAAARKGTDTSLSWYAPCTRWAMAATALKWQLHQARVRGFQEAARLLEIFSYEGSSRSLIDAS